MLPSCGVRHFLPLPPNRTSGFPRHLTCRRDSYYHHNSSTANNLSSTSSSLKRHRNKFMLCRFNTMIINVLSQPDGSSLSFINIINLTCFAAAAKTVSRPRQGNDPEATPSHSSNHDDLGDLLPGLHGSERGRRRSRYGESSRTREDT